MTRALLCRRCLVVVHQAPCPRCGALVSPDPELTWRDLEEDDADPRAKAAWEREGR